MRPIKLTIKAFGPYRDIETIDFNELKDRNLFLITGPTGAGKTTIFDAISFAMYGEASGNIRSAESLRSQFANDNMLTEVELEFELKGIRYHIHRIPKQQKPKARGEGFTEQKSDATLTIYGEDENKVIAGVKNVNETIEGIVGINAEQFKQIMMIPQGEFRKLLMAESEERGKVLQKLFDTKIYNAIQMKLDSQAKTLNSQIKGQRELRDHEISKIEYSENQELRSLLESEDKNIEEILQITKELIDDDNNRLKDLEKNIEQINENIKKETSKKEKDIQNNENLRIKNELELEIKSQEEISSQIKSKEQKIEKAKKAVKITYIEDSLKSKQSELKTKQDEKQDIQKKIIEENQSFEQLKSKLEKEESKESNEIRNKVFEELTKLKSFREKVVKIDSFERQKNENEKNFESIEKARIENNQKIRSSKENIEELKKEYEKTKDAKIQLVNTREKYREEERTTRIIEELIDINKTRLRLDSDYILQVDKNSKILNDLNELEEKYKKKKIDFLMNQAAILAKDLKEGDECPVCGSIHHIKLASFANTEISQDEIEKLESRLQVIKDKYSGQILELEKIKSDIRSSETSFKDKYSELLLMEGSELEDSLNVDLLNKGLLKENLLKEDLLNKDLSQKSEAIEIETIEIEAIETKEQEMRSRADIEKQDIVLQEKKLKNQQKLESIKQQGLSLKRQSELHDKLEKELKELEEIIKGLESEREKKEKEYNDSNESLLKVKSELESIYKDVPEDIRMIKSLEMAIEQKEKQKKQLDESLESTRKGYESSNLNLTRLKTREDEITNHIKELQRNIEESSKDFINKIDEFGFENIDDYISSKLKEEDISSLEEDIRIYSENLYSLRQRHIELTKKTTGIELVDISSIEEKIQSLELENKELIDLKGNIKGRSNNNTRIIKEIRNINNQIKDKDEKNKIIGNLARIAKGNNKANMTFERYVLAAFLEDIIKAANIRLSKMTGGRYHMSRTQELQRSNAQSGLELEVYDNYTGKSRHVKTLSGGESFKASLSMALGLSDFVQSYSGGVQLDTMFIDEGFGTLDQESLDSAINCLIELQKTGRLVGIISHVQELKERIEAKLEVYATNTGSETKFVVV